MAAQRRPCSPSCQSTTRLDRLAHYHTSMWHTRKHKVRVMLHPSACFSHSICLLKGEPVSLSRCVGQAPQPGACMPAPCHAGSEPGAVRVRAAGAPLLPEGHVFGKPSAREAEPCVGELLHGKLSPEEPSSYDAHLGRSRHRGQANLDEQGRVRHGCQGLHIQRLFRPLRELAP